MVRSESSYWHGQPLRSFQAFPYHHIIDPQEEELQRLLRDHKALALRYSTAFDAPLGYPSYHVVLEKRKYGIEILGKWARKNVRRGLRESAVRPISFQLLASDGWRLHQETLDRQKRDELRDRKDWERLCLAAGDLPGFEAWGALVQGRLAASVITFQLQGCCYMLYQQSKLDCLTAHASNALSYTVTRTMIQRPEVSSIFYGLHSLDAPSSVDEFKFRMGYSRKLVRQRVCLHHACVPLFNPLTHILLKTARFVRPRNRVFAKAEGMIRFYLGGKRSLKQLPSDNCIPAQSACNTAASTHEPQRVVKEAPEVKAS